LPADLSLRKGGEEAAEGGVRVGGGEVWVDWIGFIMERAGEFRMKKVVDIWRRPKSPRMDKWEYIVEKLCS